MPAPGKPLLFASSSECEAAFYEALEAADADAVAELWLDDEDVTCIHPQGPRLLGHAAVVASWRAILGNGPVQLRPKLRKSIDTPTLALHSVIEEIIVTEGRTQQVVHVFATNAYMKTPAGWKMILHHASPAPQGQPTDVEGPQGTLH
jgi:ketosteroid isomerase-like protein